ncbi:hypothetical protein FA13DRAFT_646801 [Coprinellus micaceus]|uniref:Uncharacterized protein n=1 Tax=Coprinellus micaceus TaxID=71717 RepID=A0A4Y7T5W3_COPMI|nr:hypothetical protein FA13DRAFT_646801 [Coprinellus micaceus]
MSLPYYKPKYLPAFSLVLTSIEEDGAPVEIFALKDPRKALRRQVHINLSRSRAMPISQSPDDDPLMRTVDTRSRFSGSVAYDAEYLAGDEETTHHRTASAASTSSTSSSSSAEEDEEEDIASSTSTSEVDLNGELEVDHVSDSDAATLYECDLGELSDHNPPLYHQPAVVSSLVQTPPLPRHRYDEAIPMSVLDAQSRPISSEVSSGSSGQPRSPRPLPPSKNLGTMKFLLRFLRIFHSLWRRLKSIGEVILPGFHQGPVAPVITPRTRASVDA